MGANKIYLQVDFQSDNADAQVKKLNQEIANVGTTSEKASQQSSQSFKRVSVSVEETQRAVFGLGQAVAGLAIVRLGTDVIQSADKINRLQISLETLTGSAKQTAQIMAAMREVAASSPFAFENLLEGAKNLKAYGMAAGEIPAAMKAISNTVAAVGGTSETIDRITNALKMMYAKDAAGSRELLRGGLLRDLGPALEFVRQAVNKRQGKNYDLDTIKEMINTQALGGRELADDLLKGMMRAFPDAAKSMGLITSQVQKLQDELQQLARVIAGDLAPVINAWIERLKEVARWWEALPEWARTAIEWVLKIAAAAAALEVAWTALGAVFSGGVIATALAGIVGAFEGASVLFASFGMGAISVGELTTQFLAATPAAAAFGVALLGVADAWASFWAGGKLLDWLEEYRQKGQGIFNQSYQDPIMRGLRAGAEWLTDAAHANYLGIKILADSAEAERATNARLRATAAKDAPLTFISLKPLAAKATAEQIHAQNEMITAAINAGREKTHTDLIKTNKAAMEELDKVTMEALEQAKAHMLGGHAAVDYEVQKLYDQIERVKKPFDKTTATFAEDTARVDRIKAIKNTEVTNQLLEESQNKRRELEQKGTQEHIAEMQKASDLEVELVKETSQETLAARAAAQSRGLEVLRANEEQIRAAMDAASRARQTQQIEADRVVWERRGASAEEFAAHVAVLELQYQQEREKVVADSYQRIAKYRLDLERQVISDTKQLNEQALATERQNRIEAAQHAGDLLKSRIEVIPAQTEEQKTAQAAAGAQAEIDAAKMVEAEQLQINQNIYNDRLASLNKWLADQHGGLATQLVAYAEYLQAIGAMDRDRNAAIAQLEANRIFLTQKLENEAMKRHNEAVIQDYKEIYDQIKSGVDKVWDAMTSRAGTFAQRIGNMLKAAFMDAAKSVVTSHVTAGLMGLFNKQVTFGGGGLRQLLGKEPVFGADKMQQAGHLGDVTTVSAGGYQSVPVTVMNPSPVQQQITQNVHVSSPEKAATMMSLPGLIGLGMAASAAASPSGIPSGAVAATSSAINGVSTGPEVFQQLGSVLGAPGGTAPFAGGGAGGGISGLPASVAKLSQLGKTLGIAGSGGGGTFNLMPGSMIPGLGLGAAVAGLMGARALGTHGPGGLAGGAALGAFSGLLAAGSLAAMFPSVFVPLLAAGPVGWIAAAGIGAAIGLSSLFIKTADQKVRQKVKQVYGVDIAQKNIRMEIVQLAQQKYGGNLDVAIASPEVQEIVRMYAVATGANPSGMPRPMYSATLAESGAGGTQLQAVYQGGRIVANPYTGTTTAQFSSFATQAEDLGYPPNAGNLTAAGVIGTMAQSPGQVSAANAAALAGGYSRDATTAALIEPLTVMR